jgi:hypothetical protein
MEEEQWAYDHLEQRLAAHPSHQRVHYTTHQGSFVDGLAELRSLNPNPFSAGAPVFAFIDPFGATGMPFSQVRELLMRPSCEVL